MADKQIFPIDIITADGAANSLHKNTSEKFMENVKREEKLICDGTNQE